MVQRCYSKHDMALKLADRILTIVATATLTSAVWIVAGGSLIKNASDLTDGNSNRPSIAAPSPSPDPKPLTQDDFSVSGTTAPPLDTGGAMQMGQRSADELMVPVMNVRPGDLSDTFTDSRGDVERLHEALDIMAPKGTSIVAAAPGKIEKLFDSDAGGRTIYIRTPDGQTIHYYAHMDKYAKGLKEGQRVRRGQRLGTVGSSGNATEEAPHLHFAIFRTTADAQWWEPANPINPYPLLTGQ